MGGRSSRTKGHAFERYVAQRLRPYDKDARRNVAETQVASVDIITKLPLGIQCKCLKKWVNPQRIYMQAEDGTRVNGVIPMGLVKIDYQPREIVLMKLVHFRILFADLIKNKRLVFKRRELTKKRKWKLDFKPKKRLKKPKVSPYTLITECFDLCLPDQYPVALWRILYSSEQNKHHKATLACFDFELLLTQIEKVYGKEKDSSNLI